MTLTRMSEDFFFYFIFFVHSVSEEMLPSSLSSFNHTSASLAVNLLEKPMHVMTCCFSVCTDFLSFSIVIVLHDI